LLSITCNYCGVHCIMCSGAIIVLLQCPCCIIYTPVCSADRCPFVTYLFW
jgi:hypothetical protein